MQIKHLSEDGVPKARIARQLGVSRQTVYNHLNRKEVFPKVRAQRASKLDAYKDTIRTRLEQFDLPGTVLLQELRLQGYTGGITILREFMRPLKASLVRRVTERFETTPGRQAQMDWGECGTVQVGDVNARSCMCLCWCWAIPGCFMRSLRPRAGCRCCWGA